MKRFGGVLVLGLLMAVLGTSVALAGLEVGGDMKIRLFDMSTGSSWIPDSTGTLVEYKGTDNITMGWYGVYLHFNGQLSDNVSVEIEPSISGSSGATPRIGTKIGETASGSSSLRIGVTKAAIAWTLPWDVELSAGWLHPILTMDYGSGLWYQEQAWGGKSSANGYLGTIHDAGIELYKAFEFEVGEGNYLSLPTNLYIMNGYGGNAISDNNNNKTLLLHVEPTFSKVKLSGSFYYGMSDPDEKNSVLRYSGGLALDFNPFWFRTEYVAGTFQNNRTAGETMFDAKPMGFYAKAGVHITDWFGVSAHFDYAKHNFSSGSMDGETYTTISGILNFVVIPGSHIMLEVQKANWANDNGTKVDFIRPAVMWRTIF